MKKLLKKLLKTVLLTVLAFLLLTLGVLSFYLPRYLTRNVIVTPVASDGEELTIMSTNVRCYAPDDLFKKSLFYRMELIATDVATVLPAIVCFQEMQSLHYNYLKDVMPEYSSVMAFRDNSILPEGCAIFYQTERFEEIESGHFWLSETPDVMSKDWGSAHYRICVYACLKDRNTGKEFIVFNTHLDNKSEEARIKGIDVILDKIEALGGRPAFLMGDLNATENTPTIQSTKESFDDAKKIALSTTDQKTPTYNNWGAPSGKSLIDYVLISKGSAAVYEYHVLNNCYDGVYSSDHSSIYVKVKIH